MRAKKTIFSRVAYQPEKIILDPDLETAPVVKRILARAPHARVTRVPGLFSQSPEEQASTLYLMRNPGAFVKPCPQTPEYVCCHYRILNFSTGCPLQCAYCILNGYLHSPAMAFFCDQDRLFPELKRGLCSHPGFVRLGSGEFTDSLVLDPLTDFSLEVIPFFLNQRNTLFEMKTKTDNVGNLLKRDGGQRIMVSWSVNPPGVIDREEKGAAPLPKRLLAAEACMKNNYLIGFHFDPILRHEGWEAAYAGVVDEIYSRIHPDAIAWISLGCFRFVPGLKEVIQTRYPCTRIIYEEFVRGKDGKMRYFRPLREEMYHHIIECIGKHHPDPPVYFCMETPLVWKRVLGKKNFSSFGLSGLLDRVKTRYSL